MYGNLFTQDKNTKLSTYLDKRIRQSSDHIEQKFRGQVHYSNYKKSCFVWWLWFGSI